MAILPVGISAEEGGYQIERSLRFNSADSAYLSRTFGTATNQKIWTWSGWVKRSSLTSAQVLFGSTYSTGGNQRGWISFGAQSSTDQLEIELGDTGNTTDYNFLSNAVYRDVGAWAHIVVACDLTQATDTNRLKAYVNGVQVTFASATYPAQNSTVTVINRADVHTIGGRTSDRYFSGYLTEVNFIDGSALDPTSFGEFDTDTGVWKPKAYSGSYGTNGFYLDFADNSSTTALGYDAAGSNDWTPNNFSVTAGAGNDSLVDSPTRYGTDTGVGGEVRGNYATFNPLNQKMAAGTTTLSNGNLTATNNASSYGVGGIGTVAVTSGKWYCEVTATNISATATSQAVGIVDTSKAYNDYTGYWYRCDGQKSTDIVNGTGLTAYGNTYTTADVIGVALDMDAGEVKFYKNGTVQNSGTAAYTGLSGALSIAVGDGGNIPTYVFDLNSGQRPFSYTAPSGFKALCTTNLPDPTIADGGEYFNAVTYTGNSSTQTISGVGFQPDFTWLKGRSYAGPHKLFDAVRGATKSLSSNLTDAEVTDSDALTAFTSDGFSLGADGDVNRSADGGTHISWNWKANGAGVSNTDGTITSTVSANTTAGFSIVTYTGTGTSGQSVGHGLGVKPAFIIVKKRSTTGGWVCWHQSLTGGSEEDRYIYLNSTDASGVTTDYWGTGGITSSTFGVWATGGDNNASGATFVSYCFAPIAGYSAFGSYQGSGSTDGPMIFTGFRPRFVLVKKSSGTSNWSILDTARDTYNVADNPLLPNLSNAESTSTSTSGAIADILSNGFKARGNSGDVNDSGATYIYAAFGDPFKFALSR